MLGGQRVVAGLLRSTIPSFCSLFSVLSMWQGQCMYLSPVVRHKLSRVRKSCVEGSE